MVRTRIDGDSINTLESYKFVEDSEGNVTVRVFDTDTTVLKGGKLYKRTLDEEVQLYDSFETVATNLSTSSAKVSTPDNASSFIIENRGQPTVYIGNSSIDASGDQLVLEHGDILEVSDMQKGDNNEIYAIVASGTSVIYAIGMVKE